MFTLKGFRLSEKVYESKRSLIYRGIRESDDLPVIVKSLKARRPTREGLGLAIVKKIVEEHGGRVELSSEQDRGTKATVVIPVQPK